MRCRQCSRDVVEEVGLMFGGGRCVENAKRRLVGGWRRGRKWSDVLRPRDAAAGGREFWPDDLQVWRVQLKQVVVVSSEADGFTDAQSPSKQATRAFVAQLPGASLISSWSWHCFGRFVTSTAARSTATRRLSHAGGAQQGRRDREALLTCLPWPDNVQRRRTYVPGQNV